MRRWEEVFWQRGSVGFPFVIFENCVVIKLLSQIAVQNNRCTSCRALSPGMGGQLGRTGVLLYHLLFVSRFPPFDITMD